MARADRLERMDARRTNLETDYTAALVEALQKTAAGSWGLFDHQKDRSARARTAPILAELNDMAQAIDGIREDLGMEPFALHQQFLASRGAVASSAVGEPKQARAWLDQMGIPLR
jgi:hypothetical protein